MIKATVVSNRGICVAIAFPAPTTLGNVWRFDLPVATMGRTMETAGAVAMALAAAAHLVHGIGTVLDPTDRWVFTTRGASRSDQDC